ncbi:MAG TPA: DMT family transporter [Rhabdochlamydiaceae bacterium]|nr:DMT family transporter [Rhabdochlamydiaceae bacterium]
MKFDFSKRPEKKHGLAIFFILLFALSTASNSAAIKYTTSEISILSIIVWTYIVGAAAMLLWMFVLFPKQKGFEYLKTGQIKNQTIRSISRLVTLFLFFYALKTLSIADATLFLFTSSIFIPIIAYFWHRIGLHTRMWWGMIVAFIGIGVVLNPGKEIFQLSSLIALLSGITSAIALLSLRFAHYEEPSDRTLFYNFIISGVIALIISLFSFETTWMSLTTTRVLWLLLIGGLGLLAQIFLTFAAKYAPMRFLSPFMYITVIFGMFLDWIIWKNPPTLETYIGCLLIVIGNVLMLILYPKDDLQIRKP